MPLLPPTLVDIHKPPKRDRPEFDLYIGRAQPYPNVDERAKETSKWHNPFTEKQWGESALPMYEIYIKIMLDWYNPYEKTLEEKLYGFDSQMARTEINGIKKAIMKILPNLWYWRLSELTGMRLGCWCITTDSWENPVCHGQILMKLWHEAYQKGELDDD
jgi:hypothetical protein